MRSAETCEDASKQSDSERVKRLDEMMEAAGFGELAAEVVELRIRIEHQSLILAQDERWRRA